MVDHGQQAPQTTLHPKMSDSSGWVLLRRSSDDMVKIGEELLLMVIKLSVIAMQYIDSG